MRKEKGDMRLKYRAAAELGLMDKLHSLGWAGLSTQETGRIGGLVGKYKRENKGD